MGADTRIEWADHTFNPWTGCQAVSPACDHCYAEAQAKRAPATFGGWGPRAERKRTSESYWRQPLLWNKRAAAACAAAMTAVVTGRISTRTPRGRSSQYGSAGRSRVSINFSGGMSFGACPASAQGREAGRQPWSLRSASQPMPDSRGE